MDTRVIPSENVSTDHRMVVATIRKETRRNRIGRTFQRRSVNVKKLMKPDINRKYQEEISYKLALLPNKLNSAEKVWIDFKDIIQGTAEKMVGQKKCGGQQKKATAWWNEETRQATKLKKQLYKKWLKDATPQNKAWRVASGRHILVAITVNTIYLHFVLKVECRNAISLTGKWLVLDTGVSIIR